MPINHFKMSRIVELCQTQHGFKALNPLLLGASIRPVVSFYNTPLSALHKVLAHYLKTFANSSIRLKDNFKQHLNTTGHTNFPCHTFLDIKSLEFNGQFYSQDTGGTMGSQLVVELAEIRVADVANTALTTYKDPPNTYRRFFYNGIEDFCDKSHTDGFLNYLNSLTDDLQYTIEYPSHDGSLLYMDILIHADKSTYVYRKPTYTNLATIPVPLILQRQCHQIPYKTSSHPMLPRMQHLQKELDTVYTTSLQNGHPLTESNASWTVLNKN